jgi:sulfatase maturation enzyme AslB (radical SAM superfamily)
MTVRFLVNVELRPLGVTCNIACQYCYQNPQRDAGNFGKSYDLDAMKAAILKEGGGFTLFGGEALLVPEVDLENLLGGPGEVWRQLSADQYHFDLRQSHPHVSPI